MGTTNTIPHDAVDITPEWLTGALKKSGVLPNGAVQAIDAVALSEGVGFVGQVLRLTPTYDGASDDAPRTIIAKIPSREPGALQVAAMYGMYERELQFYRHLAEEITFRTPRFYYGDGNAQSIEYIILLEDLASSGTMGDQLAGCDLNQAERAIRGLAEHHAQWWQHKALDTTPWMVPGVDLVRAGLTQAYQASWPIFLDQFADCFSQDVLDVVPSLGERVLKTLDEVEQGAMTIAHGDYRADNLFFGTPNSGYDVAVIDWQSPNKGWGAYDLAYFICGSFDADLRHKHESALCDLYYETLTTNGVRNYDRGQFDIDYARSLLVYLAIFVINAATLDMANDRGLALFRAIYNRLNGSIADANALTYLPA